ncbi:MAG: radical SAM protein [Pseudomonadota bacterium]|nr:radical SAM protein [Pseudomonadota bacterium]
MDQLLKSFTKVYISKDAVTSDAARRFFDLIPHEKIAIVSERPYPEVQGSLSASEYDRSKRELFLTHYQGQFFKKCPGFKPGLVCCNYFVLNLGLQCNMNCSYCYLQSYLNTPVTTIYSNINDALSQLELIAQKFSAESYRVGTGETVDSLSLDELTLYSRHLISFFNRYPKWELELKTKSKSVDQFLDVDHVGNTVISWSINPEHIISREEHGTASLSERFSAAQKCLNKNFKVNFHIDPLIWHPEWQDNYFELVDQITRRFSPQDIPHISLGALRFQPEQRHIMRERFGMKSYVTRAEVHLSSDGKLRYDLRLRNEMFTAIINRFKSQNSAWNVIMCMETPETWLAHQGINPRSNESMNPLFRPLKGEQKVSHHTHNPS